MAQFQLLRYLKKWRYLIVAVCLLGCFAVYYYCNSSQQYTATAVIQYTHANAENGQNPNGSLLDATEMISSSVISDVIRELDMDNSVESIRSQFSIKAVVPAEETEKENAYLALGQEYVYQPTIYQISYTVDSKASAEEARTMLDALLSNYFAYYCEKYVDYSAFPGNAANLTNADMEYMDCLSVLSTTLENSIYYLTTRSERYPDFFSAMTGYSFRALMERYEYIRDTDLARLHAYVLGNRLVKDKDILLERYRNSIDQYELQLDGLDEQIEGTRELISQFSEKTLNNTETPELTTPSGDSGKVLETVMDNSGITAETTYDGLISQYTELMDERIVCQTRLSRTKELLETFSRASTDTQSEQMAWADAHIEDITAGIGELYDVTMLTLAEFTEKNGADNLAMLTNVVTSQRMNTSRYLMLAVVAFVIIGCGLAVLCGRAEDFIDYFLYADRRTGLPNRMRCDGEIELRAGKLLKEDFCCFVFRVKLNQPSGEPLSRKKGDEMLSGFARVMRFAFEKMGFIGYNDNGMFLAFADDCTKGKADELLRSVQGLVKGANTEERLAISYESGYAVTTLDNVYDIRSLLRLAIKRCEPDVKKEAEQ